MLSRLHACVFHSSGMQQIYDQIQQRLEEKHLHEEMKELEKQQVRENQERMNLEDLQVGTPGGDTTHKQNEKIHIHVEGRVTTHTHTHKTTRSGMYVLWLDVSLQALVRKREEQQHLQEEVMRINAETMQAKEQRREEEKLADIRDIAYIRKKQVRSKPGSGSLHRRKIHHTNSQYSESSVLHVIINKHASVPLVCFFMLIFLSSAGARGRIWSRAETNQEGEGARDRQTEGKARKSQRLQGRAGARTKSPADFEKPWRQQLPNYPHCTLK